MRQSIPRGLRTLGWVAGSVSSHPRLTRSFGLFSGKKKTHYETLEIQSNATVKDVKKAFMKKGSFPASFSQDIPPRRGPGQV